MSIHCQSCTQPIEKDADFGTEADGSRSRDYCSCCYQNGAFTEPEVTMDQMLARVIDICAEHNIMSREQAERELPVWFASLKRWAAPATTNKPGEAFPARRD